MKLHKPEEIFQITINTGMKKANNPFLKTMILGFQAGAYIALGYLLYVRLTAPFTGDLEGLGKLIGASVFPIGLILTLIAGGELLTGNMMAVPLAFYAKKVNGKLLAKNIFLVTIANFLGAIFVAYFFGHVVGLTETGHYLEATVSIAGQKLETPFLQAFISGIGCNWLVSAAVWLSYGSNDMMGKIAGIWFPVMTFVAIGFQHIVANMFIIPAAIFAGYYSWGEYFINFVPVFLGNGVGGAIFVAMAYFLAYRKDHNNVAPVKNIKSAS